MKYDPENCPCKRVKCERYGQCKVCLEHHRALRGRKQFAACEKAEIKKEKEYKKMR